MSDAAAVKATFTDDVLAQIDDIFAKANHPDTPGAALGVVQDGGLVLERYYGCADLEHGVPVSADSVFDIASTSKQFTAAALVLLDQRGELSLDDEVHTYLPELPTYERPMTLRHLIHHTSGLRDYLGVMALVGARPFAVWSAGEILEVTARQTTLNFPPGERHSYCNTGYVLMGIVVTRVTGQSFPDFVRENILEPLGMTRSSFRDDPTRLIPGVVRGYTFGDGAYHKTNEGLDDAPGDGGLISSVAELAKWDRNYIEETVGGPGFTEQMERVGTPDGSEMNYAFGLAAGEYRGLRTVGHGGALYGFSGDFLRFPTERFTVIVQANVGGFDAAGIAHEVADVLLGDRLAPVIEAAAHNVDDAGPAARTAGTRDAELLGMYIDADTGSAFDVTLSDGSLCLVVREMSIPLRRKRGDLFRTDHPVYSLDIEFDAAGPDGTIIKLYNAGEVVTRLTLVTPPDPEEIALGELVGRYVSPELDAVYDVRTAGPELHLWRALTGRDVLRATLPDEFASSFGRLRFERDDAGAVTGLVADTSRASGVRFERTG